MTEPMGDKLLKVTYSRSKIRSVAELMIGEWVDRHGTKEQRGLWTDMLAKRPEPTDG